jgi:hypothetical protein
MHLVKRQCGIGQIDGVAERYVAHAAVIREASLRHRRQGALLVGVSAIRSTTWLPVSLGDTNWHRVLPLPISMKPS